MKSIFFVFVIVAIVLSGNGVEGVGEVILDSILPVKDTKVTFEDPVFTNHGIITNIDTGSFEVTRQFELNVEVPDVFLTGLSAGGSFSGSLGGLISSSFGDVVFQAATDIDLSGSEINAIARNDLRVASQSGDIRLQATYPIELVAGGVSIHGKDALSVVTTGAMSVKAGDDLSILSDGTASFASDKVFSFEARTGNVLVAAGNELVYSADGIFRADGTHGVSLSSAGELALIGGRTVRITANTADSLVRNNATFEYTQISFLGDDGVVFGGRTVDLTASGRLTVEGSFPGSVVSVDFGVLLEVSASNDINLRTSGETADVHIVSTDFTANVGSTFTVEAQDNIEFGSNSTDSFTIDATSYNMDANYASISSDDQINVSTKTSTTFESDDMFVHGTDIKFIATGASVTFDSRDFHLLNRIGGVFEDVEFSSTDDMTTNSNNLVLAAFRINGDFTGDQTYTLSGDLFVTSTADQNISFFADDDISISVDDDIDIITANSQFISEDTLSFSVVDYNLFAKNVEMIADDITLTIVDDTTLTSANHLIMESGTSSWSAGDEIRVTGSGTGSVDADDLSFDAFDDVELTAARSIHMDISEESEITTGSFEIETQGNTYFKTSVFSAVGDGSFEIISANDINGRFGDLTINAGNDLDFETSNDLSLFSGGSIGFVSSGDQNTDIGDDLDVFVQETTRFDAGNNLRFDVADTIEFSGSEELFFSSQADMDINGGNNIVVNGDILEYNAAVDLTVNAGTISYQGGDVLVDSGNDLFFNANEDITFSTLQGTREMVFNGRNLDFDTGIQFTTTGDDSTFKATSYSVTAGNDISVNTQFTDISTASVATTSSGKSSLTADEISFVTGFDRYYNVNSAAKIEFDAVDNFEMNADSFIEMTAQTMIDINSQNTLRFSSVDTTTISSAGIFAASGTNSVTFSAAEDLSFTTTSKDITMTSAVDSIDVRVGRDFHLVANGLKGTCGIAVATTGGNQAIVETTDGLLTTDSWKTMEIHSSGNVEVIGGGNIFAEAYESGLAFFAEGTTAGIDILTNSPNAGNIEFLSTEAEVRMFAFGGFDIDSLEDMRLTAERELNITALSSDASPTIFFDADQGAYFTAARGMTFLAGLDAPAIDSDLSVTATDIYVESQDRLYARAIGKFTATINDASTITTYEGNTLDMSAAAAFTMTATNDIEFTTFDGDQTFTANNDHLRGVINEDISIDTTDGPISMEALAGRFTLSGNDWIINSVMDTRALALGNITLKAGAGLQVASTSSDCILIQNERAVDNVFFNGNNIRADSNSGELDFDHSNILVVGQHVDFIVENVADFTSTDGPIGFGGDSSPVVRMIAGGDTMQYGVSVSSPNDIQTVSSSTISFDAVQGLITSDFANVRSSGFVTILAQQDDVNFIADNGLIVVDGEVISNTITDDHIIRADTLSIDQTGDDIDGRLAVTATGDVSLLASTASFIATSLNDMDVLGDHVLSAEEITFQSNVPDDTNFIEPFFSDIANERGNILFTVEGDILVDSVDEATVTVGRTDPGVPLNNAPTFTLDTNEFFLSTVDLAIEIMELGALLNMNAGTTFTATTEGTYDIDTAPLPEGANTEPFANHPSDVSFHAATDITMSSVGNFVQNSVGGTEYDVGDSATFDFVNQFGVTATDEGLSSLIEFNAGSTLSLTSQDTFTVTNVVPPSSTLNDFEEEYEILFDSDNDIAFAVINSFDVFSTGQLNYEGSSVDVIIPTLTATAATMQFLSDDLASDVLFQTTTTRFTGQDFSAAGYEGVLVSTSGLQTYDADDLDARATYGDIFLEGSTTVITSVASDMIFEAFGYQSDNERAITFTAGSLTFDSIGSTTIEAQDRIEILSDDQNVLTAIDYLFQSTGFDSPIEWVVYNDIISLTTATNIDIEGGYGTFFSAPEMALSATSLTVSTGYKQTGIVFDTDIQRNSLSAVQIIAGTTLTLNSVDFSIETDFSRAENSPIEFTIDDMTVTSSGNYNIPFIAEEGAIQLSATTALDIETDDLRMFGDTHDWDLGAWTATLAAGDIYMDSFNGDIRFDDDMIAGTLQPSNDLLIRSQGVGLNNDIAFTAALNLEIGSDGTNVFFHGNRGSSGIHIENDASNNADLTMDGRTTKWETLSGISITGTKHSDPDDADIDFLADGDITIETKDKRGIVFFQSDRDTIIESNNLINHSNYNARLGFFSEVPDWIHLVQMQDTEGCNRGGWCGFTSPSSRGNANGNIADLNAAAVAIQECIRQFGLINWKHNLV